VTGKDVDFKKAKNCLKAETSDCSQRWEGQAGKIVGSEATLIRERGTAYPTSPRPDRQSGLKRHLLRMRSRRDEVDARAEGDGNLRVEEMP
jgi:hypothetical protein